MSTLRWYCLTKLSNGLWLVARQKGLAQWALVWLRIEHLPNSLSSSTPHLKALENLPKKLQSKWNIPIIAIRDNLPNWRKVAYEDWYFWWRVCDAIVELAVMPYWANKLLYHLNRFSFWCAQSEIYSCCQKFIWLPKFIERARCFLGKTRTRSVNIETSLFIFKISINLLSDLTQHCKKH